LTCSLLGKTQINKVLETENVLTYYHTKPFYPVHSVVKVSAISSN